MVCGESYLHQILMRRILNWPYNCVKNNSSWFSGRLRHSLTHSWFLMGLRHSLRVCVCVWGQVLQWKHCSQDNRPEIGQSKCHSAWTCLLKCTLRLVLSFSNVSLSSHCLPVSDMCPSIHFYNNPKLMSTWPLLVFRDMFMVVVCCVYARVLPWHICCHRFLNEHLVFAT